VTNWISGCVIWPTFCRSDMPATMDAMRASSAASRGSGLAMAGQSASGGSSGKWPQSAAGETFVTAASSTPAISGKGAPRAAEALLRARLRRCVMRRQCSRNQFPRRIKATRQGRGKRC
jgi:hypothetical protein